MALTLQNNEYFLLNIYLKYVESMHFNIINNSYKKIEWFSCEKFAVQLGVTSQS